MADDEEIAGGSSFPFWARVETGWNLEGGRNQGTLMESGSHTVRNAENRGTFSKYSSAVAPPRTGIKMKDGGSDKSEK